MEEEKNPWDEDYVAPSASTAPAVEADPWEETYQGGPSETETLAGEDPLYNDLNRMRDEGAFDKIQEERPVTVRSYDELYSGVRNNPKYKELYELEESTPHSLMRPWLTRDPKFDKVKEERDAELRRVYEQTGEETTDAFGNPIRVQEQKLSNPDFDPNAPIDEDNPVDISKRFYVDEPDREPLMNMGYQILENIVGGIGDLITEGKISGEGKVSAALPDVVPNDTGEAFATEMATYIVGGAAASKVASRTAGLVKDTLAARAAVALSPEAQASIRETYQSVLKATGSAGKAMQAAGAQSKRVMVGLSLGLVEGTIAPDDSEGLTGQVIGIDNIKNTFGVDEQRAKDIALVLDAPVIGGTLSAMGKMYDAVKTNIVAPSLGGIRNINPFGANVGKAISKMTMSDKDAGLKMITWLDPELAAKSSPEEAVFRIKVLADALERNATKNLKLGSVGKEVAMDTPSAFTEIAEDYYRMAYGNLKNRPDMLDGKTFDEWVGDRAARSANRLFELRTSLSGDSNVSQKMAEGSSEINELFREGADAQAPTMGSLEGAQGQAGDVLAQEQRIAEQTPIDMRDTAEKKMIASREAADQAIASDPEIQKLIRETDLDDLGSNTKLNKKLMESFSEPLYNSFKNLRTKVEDSYGKIAQTGVKGDPTSIFQIVKDSGHVDKDGNITNPILNRIVQNVRRDASFDNIYNTIRKDVSTAIGNTADGKDPMGIRQTLLELSDNIRNGQLDYLRANGNAEVAQMVDEAKSAYTTYRTAFDQQNLKSLANREGRNRLRGENLPQGVGVGQGRADWDINSVRTIQSGLEGATGERFREELDRAVKAGGEDISKPLAEYYAAESITNLANKLKSGDKQNVKTLRSALKGVVENLQRSGSTDLVDTFKRVEARAETLENAAKLDEKSYDGILKEVENLQKNARESVLKRFLASGNALGQGGTAQTMKTIFKGPKGNAQVKELLDKADTLGERGLPIKEAIRGTYLDSLRERMFSSQSLGTASVKGGTVHSGFKANESNIRKIFEKGSKDLENLQLIFKDEPQVLKELEEIGGTLTNVTKTTPSKAGDILGSVPNSQDPEKAMSAATTIMFGVLNPTATRIRKFTGPMSIANLQQVREAREAVMIAMLTDPKGFANMSRQIAKDTESKEAAAWARGIIARAGLRSAATTNDELNRLK